MTTATSASDGRTISSASTLHANSTWYQKSTKKKSNAELSQGAEADTSEVSHAVEPDNSRIGEVVETPTSKKKKKEGPEVEEEEKVEDESENESGTSAAEKKKNKKKKKKEEEKEIKAQKASKLPKHVREMQEALARRKEAEERAAKEAEEKQRREEEERIKQEELERQADEAQRRKKDKEKEKLQKKRQEGKLLSAKQKEEARRLEAMRNQFLSATGGVMPLAGGDTAKRPFYQKNKSKRSAKEAEVDSAELEEKLEVAESANENRVEEEDDDEWDTKSWDDVEKDLKRSLPAGTSNFAVPATKKAIPSQPSKSEKADESKNDTKAVKDRAKVSEIPPKSGEEDLRSPICCIMGHVDTGKTKLLDCIRGTNIQEGEAGGITQQIGATYFPAANIRERTKELKADAKLKVPGLLVIDTPGHESFTNLRSRDSGLCDIAVLVVDIMHGLEPQTIESLNLLRMRDTEFIVALNKIDRLYGWKSSRNAPFVKSWKQQSKDVKNEFNTRLSQIVTQFKEQGLNTALYYKNTEMGETFSIVPTSAITGEGIPELLLLLVQWTQKTMVQKLTFNNELQCTVLEVKVVEGHGTTIDVVLVDGVLHEGDQIVVSGTRGPIVTSIRALLTPHPMKELRVKGTYLHHKEIKAAQGIKITAQGHEHAIAATSLYVVGPQDDLEDVKGLAMEDMQSVMNMIDRSSEGVYVQASTLGSLEALVDFLKTPDVNIPVSGISIGPVHKKDVMKASAMLEKKKEFAVILAFDAKVTPEARDHAASLGVKIFRADIIYNLSDQFISYIDNLKEERKKESADEAVFQCVLKILPNGVYRAKDPIVLGVDVLEGIVLGAKVGSPICIPQRKFVDIGRIASIKSNNEVVDTAKKGSQVSIKIVGSNPEEQQENVWQAFRDRGRACQPHLEKVDRDTLKANYRDDLSMEDWKLVVKLKTLFKIQ